MSRNLKMALLSVALMAGFGSGATQAIPVDDSIEIDVSDALIVTEPASPEIDATPEITISEGAMISTGALSWFRSSATISVSGFVPDVLPPVEKLVPRTISICACFVMVRLPIVMDFGSLASISSFSPQSTAVPEPDSLALFGLALPGLLAMRRSTRR